MNVGFLDWRALRRLFPAGDNVEFSIGGALPGAAPWRYPSATLQTKPNTLWPLGKERESQFDDGFILQWPTEYNVNDPSKSQPVDDMTYREAAKVGRSVTPTAGADLTKPRVVMALPSGSSSAPRRSDNTARAYP